METLKFFQTPSRVCIALCKTRATFLFTTIQPKICPGNVTISTVVPTVQNCNSAVGKEP